MTAGYASTSDAWKRNHPEAGRERAEERVAELEAERDAWLAAGAPTAREEIAQWREAADHYAAKYEALREAVANLADDMRTWCSPFGVAVDYADRIEALLTEGAE